MRAQASNNKRSLGDTGTGQFWMTWSSKHKVQLLFDSQYGNATLEVGQNQVQCATRSNACETFNTWWNREGRTGRCHHSPDKPTDDGGKERGITPILGFPIVDAKPDLHLYPPTAILLPHFLAPMIFSVAANECRVFSFPVQLDQIEL